MPEEVGTDIQVRKYGKFSFPIPRQPHIRAWAMKKYFPTAPWVSGYDSPGGCLRVNPDTPSTFPMITDHRDTDTWTTADTTDFVFVRPGTTHAPLEGWIYLSLGEHEPHKFAIYVYDDGTSTGTIFGEYTGPKEKPKPFPDGGENYFWEMSDDHGLWLWLYRFYGPTP